MDKIQKGIEQKEIERINAIMAQLEQQGKDNAAKITGGPRSNHGFVRTLEEKDIFADTEEAPQLRKDFKSRAEIAKEKQTSPSSQNLDPLKKKPKLFDYEEAGLDKGMSLRKQIEQNENKDKLTIEEENRLREAERQARIANRASQDLASQNGIAQMDELQNDPGGIISRSRRAANIRAATNFQEESAPIMITKKEPDDAEFVQNLNNSFKKERGFSIKLNPESEANKNLSFSQLASKISHRGKVGKVASSGLKSSGFATKILGRRESQPNQFSKPNLEEHLELMNQSKENVLYKQKQEEAMKQQGEKVQEILSNAPLSSPNIGPIKPVVQTNAKRLNKTGVKLPVNFQSNSPTVTPTTPTTPSSGIDLKREPLQEGSSGSQLRPPVVPSVRNGSYQPQRPSFPPTGHAVAGHTVSLNHPGGHPMTHSAPPVPPTGPPFAPPANFSAAVPQSVPVVPPVRPPPHYGSSSNHYGSSSGNHHRHQSGGWKDPPKSGWNDSPPREYHQSPNGIVHVTPNVSLKRVTDSNPKNYSTPPPVIRREYSPANYPPGPPPVVTHRPSYHEKTVKSTPSVILKRQYDSDSEGPTPPPTSETMVDLTELYRRHPQLWQGFVTIKKHAAMVQLHYLSGDKILVQSVLPVFPTMTGSDNSKHPALKVTSRVKLDDTTFTSLRTKMRESSNYSLLLGLPCGVSEQDVEQQKTQLRVNFMNYFTSKAAAGVVEIKSDGVQYLVYMFPSCALMQDELAKFPDFKRQTSDLPQLMVAIFPSK